MRVKVRLLIEGVGRPEEYLRKELEEVLKKVERVCKVEESSVSIEEEDGLFFGALEMVCVFENFFSLLTVIADYSPILVEVLGCECGGVDQKDLEDGLVYLATKLNDMVIYNREVSARLVEVYKKLDLALRTRFE